MINSWNPIKWQEESDIREILNLMVEWAACSPRLGWSLIGSSSNNQKLSKTGTSGEQNGHGSVYHTPYSSARSGISCSTWSLLRKEIKLMELWLSWWLRIHWCRMMEERVGVGWGGGWQRPQELTHLEREKVKDGERGDGKELCASVISVVGDLLGHLAVL